jgi:hypothetical protein
VNKRERVQTRERGCKPEGEGVDERKRAQTGEGIDERERAQTRGRGCG